MKYFKSLSYKDHAKYDLERDFEVTIRVVTIFTCGDYITAHAVLFCCFCFLFFAEKSSERTELSFLLGLLVQGVLTAVV